VCVCVFEREITITFSSLSLSLSNTHTHTHTLPPLSVTLTGQHCGGWAQGSYFQPPSHRPGILTVGYPFSCASPPLKGRRGTGKWVYVLVKTTIIFMHWSFLIGSNIICTSDHRSLTTYAMLDSFMDVNNASVQILLSNDKRRDISKIFFFF